MKTTQILNKLEELQKTNTEFFEEKAELEEQILAIDIGIHNIMKQHNKLLKELNKKLKK